MSMWVSDNQYPGTLIAATENGTWMTIRCILQLVLQICRTKHSATIASNNGWSFNSPKLEADQKSSGREHYSP